MIYTNRHNAGLTCAHAPVFGRQHEAREIQREMMRTSFRGRFINNKVSNIIRLQGNTYKTRTKVNSSLLQSAISMPKWQLAGYMEGEIFHAVCEWKTEINIFYFYYEPVLFQWKLHHLKMSFKMYIPWKQAFYAILQHWLTTRCFFVEH